jgi:spermidine synthase
LPVLAGLFFWSGLAGLVYQVLWLRLLALVFGVTVWAAATVLAAFMAGLALGSFGAGKLVDRAARPLRWYGLAEVLVGGAALATPLVLGSLERLYVALYPALPQSPELLTALRFGLSFLVLLVPTTLMGATLPIILKSALLRREGLGERAGLLYATNTAGAVGGTLLAGFVLIGTFGTSVAFGLAAAINLAVGAAAILAAQRLPAGAGTVEQEPRPQPSGTATLSPVPQALRPTVTQSAQTTLSPATRRLVLLVFGLSGFVSLALEVIWFRVLVLFLQVTTYAFTIMLATVLLGIAVGSYLVTPFMRRRVNWLVVLAALELGIGVSAVLSLATLANAYELAARVQSVIGRPSAGQLAIIPIASFLALFPTTLLLGVAFPIGLRLWTGEDQVERSGERIGVFYSLNVFGAILGSVAAGFLLLPWLGSRWSLIAVAAVSLACGLLLAAALSRLRQALTLAGVGGALFLAATAIAPDPFQAALQDRFSGEQMLWREEGVQTTVTVHEQPGGQRVLYMDGLHQANDDPAMVAIHHMIGHMPVALHPSPRDALVIGLGGGATAGAVSRYPGIEVDVIELSANVIRGAELFSHINNDLHRRPNVHMRVDDGRNYLLLTPKKYDIITADIIIPTHAGAGNLYSAEYYRLARNALKDDGVMLQWIGGVSETKHKLLMRTFLSVFPEATLWFNSILMVGTKQPLQLDRAAFERKLANPAWREALESAGLPSFEALLDQYWAGPEELWRYVGDGPILTDDRPMVEYFLSLPIREPDPDLSEVRGDPLRHVRQ